MSVPVCQLTSAKAVDIGKPEIRSARKQQTLRENDLELIECHILMNLRFFTHTFYRMFARGCGD